MDHFEALGESKKAFGVADEQVAAGIQAVPEFVDEPLFVRLRQNKSSRCGTE